MTDYRLMEKLIRDFANDEAMYLPVLSNAAAIIMDSIPGINWVGFYLKDDNGLYLGPFQGKPCAVMRIPAGKGLCNAAVKKNDMIYVPDVHGYPDYIAADRSTDSELICPIRANNTVIGVLTINSPILNRFSVSDRDNIRRLVSTLEKTTDFSALTGKLSPSAASHASKDTRMPFELWLYAIKGLAQTYEMVDPIYSQLSDQEKKTLREEYEKTA